MANIPVILLAFANEKTEGGRPLHSLDQELRGITLALETAREKGLCELEIIPDATISQITDAFRLSRLKDRISIFHYAGHADGNQLLLETDKGGNERAAGEGLSSFFEEQKNLKMIFLNGCSTERLATDLTLRGIPMVIGTTASIPDTSATELSINFYKGLGNGAGIGRAWRETVAELHMTAQTSQAKGDVLFDRKGEIEGAYMPWRMFVKDGADIIKDWNLPDESENPLFSLPELTRNDLPIEPFRFLRWYSKEHAEVFFGRSYYIRELYERITDARSAPVILLYGKTGAGKSSLLDAGLIPRLEQESTIEYDRKQEESSLLEVVKNHLGLVAKKSPDTDDWDQEIRHIQALLSQSKQPLIRRQLSQLLESLNTSSRATASSGLLPLADAWMRKEAEEGKPYHLILDQMEVVFTLKNEKAPEQEEQEELLLVKGDKPIRKRKVNTKEVVTLPPQEEEVEIEELLMGVKSIFGNIHKRPKGKLILSYRKEYHPEIEKLCRQYEIPYQSVFLEPLKKKDIIEVVSGLSKSKRLKDQYQLSIEEELPEIIADDLMEDRDSSIAPILQILLTKMWQQAGEEDNRNGEERKFTIRQYQTLRKQGILLNDFFHQQLQVLKSWQESIGLEEGNAKLEESGLVMDILNFHTTDLGTSRVHKLEEIRKRYVHREDILARLLKKLDSLYLLVEGQGSYRLAHDTLGPLIQNEFKQSDRPGQRAVRILENKRALFETNSETYIDEDDLELVEEGRIGMRIWVQKEPELIEKSRIKREELRAERRRNRRFKRLAVTALAGFGLVVSWMWYQSDLEARANEKIALALEAERLDGTLALNLASEAMELRPRNVAILKNTGKIYAENEFYDQVYLAENELTSVLAEEDKGLIWAGDSRGKLWKWNAEGELVDTIAISSQNSLNPAVNDLSLSHDGKLLAIAGGKEVHVYDENRRPLKILPRNRGAVRSVAFWKEEDQILEGRNNGQVSFWTLSKNAPDTVLQAHDDIINEVVISPDNEHFVTVSDDQTAKLWSRPGELIHTLKGHADRVLSATYSPDGRYILTAARDKTIILWDTSGVKIRQFLGHTARINRVVFEEDGRSFYSASDDRSMIRWDLEGNILQTFKGHQNYVNDVWRSSKSAYTYTTSEDKSVKRWIRDSKLLHTYTQVSNGAGGRYVDGIRTAAYSSRGKFLATGGYRFYEDAFEEYTDRGDKSQNITLWELDKEKPIILSGHEDGILSLAFTNDEQTLLSASRDGRIKSWDLNKQNPLGTDLTSHEGEASAVVLAPDQSYGLSGGEDGLIKKWNLEGDSLDTFRASDWITCLAIHPTDGMFASGGFDLKVTLWVPRNGQMDSLPLATQTATVVSLAFSPDGAYLASGNEHNTIMIWSEKGELIREIKYFGGNLSGLGSIQSLAFSDDGEHLLMAGTDGTAAIFDLEGNLLQTIPASVKELHTAAYSPDNTAILTAGSDGKARVFSTLNAYLESGKVYRY